MRVAAVGLLLVALAFCVSASASASIAVAGDGTRLVVFVAPRAGSGEGRARLEVVSRSGRVLRVLSDAQSGTWARWSPDEASIAWEDPSGIHVESAEGSRPRLLVPATDCQGCPQFSFIWSPDSRALVVGSAGAKGNQLEFVPIDGSAPSVLVTSMDSKRVFTPAWWTPDGHSLIYSETRSVAITGASMRMLTPPTGKTVTLWSVPTAQAANVPVISPDLRYWAYVEDTDQYHERVRIVDRATGRTHVVVGVNSTNLLSWSPDSHVLGIVEHGGHIVTVSPTGVIVHRFGPGDQFVWGRDSSELYILRDDYSEVFASDHDRAPALLFRLPEHRWLVSLDAN